MTINTLPAAGASFFNTLNTFLQEEDADRFKDMFTGFVVSGGTHGTIAALTDTPDALTAYPGGHFITETGSITYPDDTTHIWVICHKDTTSAVTNWTRVAGTHYLFRNTGSATKPALPDSDTAILMKVTTAAGSITVVEDHRELSALVGLSLDSSNGAVFNETGDPDFNLRVESDLNTHMLFVDAGNNSVHIDNNLLTGAGDGDLVLANGKFIRWINSAGTSSGNLGIFASSGNNMTYRVPATTDRHDFEFVGAARLRLAQENGGGGITIVGESSSDHAAPAGTGCVLYLTDAGAGKQQLMARFNTGAAQQVALEP